MIPVAALQTRADATFVYSIVNGKAVEQPITILAQGGTTAVVKGVDAGMQVILNPPPGLLVGSSVQAVAVPSSQGQVAAPEGSASPGAQGTDQKNRGGGQRPGAAPGGGRPGQPASGGKQ
jgi:HlyD family secretion protein